MSGRNSSPNSTEGTMKSSVCKECGCQCKSCGNESPTYFDLHQQIAELHGQLQRSGSHIASIEHELMDSKQASDLELIKTKEDLNRLRERYDRLLESHKRMQKINHDLEEKLLKLVNQFEIDKLSLQKELSSLMNRLVDARMLINDLDQESEKYRVDCNVAVQLLQCKPSNFVAHKLNTLPLDLQERVRLHMSHDQLLAADSASGSENRPSGNGGESQRLIRVPIATFPPTAMVFSLNQSSNKQNSLPMTKTGQGGDGVGDTDLNKGFVPMSIIARALSQKQTRRLYPRMYLCQGCRVDVFHTDKGCQVDLLPPRGTARTVEITTVSHSRSREYVHDHTSRAGRRQNLSQHQSQMYCGLLSPQDGDRSSGDEGGSSSHIYRPRIGSETNL